MKNITIIILGLFISQFGWSQISTDTFYVSQDAFVNSGASTTNYGSDTLLNVYHDTASTVSVYRSFLEFDVSTLPANAIIVSATLKLYPVVLVDSIDHPIYIERVDSLWYEDSIKWDNQSGAITSDQLSFTHAQTSGTSMHEFDVKDHVEKMVWYDHINYGFRIRLQDESDTADYGIKYASSEHDTVSWRPSLEIEYVLPIIIDGDVTHCTSGNNDGSINVTVSGGYGVYTFYQWYRKVGAGYAGVENGTDIANVDVDNLQDALYLLYLDDSLGNREYRYFFVGEENDTTNVEFIWSNATWGGPYLEDAYLKFSHSDLDSMQNFGSATRVQTSNSPTTYDSRSLVKYKVDYDQLLEFTRADQALKSMGHYQHNQSDNDSWLQRVTEPWEEDWVTWGIRPAVTAVDRVNIPGTTINGYEYRDDTLDVLDFVYYWQDNPDENYGWELSLQSYDHGVLAMMAYASGDYIPHNFYVSYTVKPPTETTFTDSTNLGDITVNAPAGDLPYSYFISKLDTLPILDSIWVVLKDSIPIDSSSFWQGSYNKQNYTFKNLVTGKYYISVFDSNGDRVIDQYVELMPALSFIDSVDIVIDNDTISVDTTGGTTKAKVIWNSVVPSRVNGGIEVEVTQLDDDVAFGFNDTEDTRVYFDFEFEYAYRIKASGDTLEVIEDGLPVDTFTVAIGDILLIQKEFSEIVFYKNGTELYRGNLPSEIPNYYPEILFKGLSSEVLYHGTPSHWNQTVNKRIEQPNCFNHQGLITLFPTSYHDYYLNSYTITDQNSSWTVNGSTFPAQIIMPLGSYDLSLNWTNGTTSFTTNETFIIGFEVAWNVGSNMTVDSYNSVTPNSSGWADIQSINQTSTTNNWVEFTHVPDGSSSQTQFSLEDESGDAAIEVNIYQYGSNKYVWVKSDGVTKNLVSPLPAGYSAWSTSVLLITDDLPLRIEQNNTTFSLIHNGNTLYTYTSTIYEDLSIDVRINGRAYIQDVMTSFCYPMDPDYVKLERIPDGGYYNAFGGILKVEYDEEYNDDDLIFNVYEEDRDISESETSMTISAISYGDNRLTFSFTTTDCIPDGYYMLEVINKKNEKRYLRFKITDSGC